MNHHYRDITERIEGDPLWWDEVAVPRYCEFGPEHVAEIYATEAALVSVACQNCGRVFPVSFSWRSSDKYFYDVPALSERIEAGHGLEYGDPPNYGCCPAGPTMNSEAIQVLQFWRRSLGTSYHWERVTDLEGKAAMPEWAKD